MRKSHVIVVITLSLALICSAAFAAEPTSAGAAASAAGSVNINTADGAQLAYLPRVGAKAAQRIIDYRKEHGPFHKTSDLMQVKGFGQKTFDRLSTYLNVDGKTTLSAKVSGPKKARSSRKQPASTASK
ncbi:MAG: competence protein [Acidobacteria bacterium]|nr:competence protein [Acidobacteriota bacterium]